jgi:hypothetical protein
MLLDIFSHVAPTELHRWIISVPALSFVRVHESFGIQWRDSIHHQLVWNLKEPVSSIEDVEENNVVTGTQTKSRDGKHLEATF